jgi:hypothetical protein
MFQHDDQSPSLNGEHTNTDTTPARLESRPQPQGTAATPPAPGSPSAPKPPLPVAVAFRPASTGTGQTVHLTGAPGIEPILVAVTTYRTGKPGVPPVPVPKQVRGRAALWLLLTAEEREQGSHVAVEASVLVRPSVEMQVVWDDRAFVLPPGQAIVLESPGYDTLRTSIPVPLKRAAPPATEFRP